MPDLDAGARAGRGGLSVYLAGTGLPDSASCIPEWRRLADLDRFGTHRLVDEPDEADVILFTEAHLLGDWRLRAIRDSPLSIRWPERTYVYDERDRPWCALPGLYVSMPERSFRAEWQVPVGYYRIPDTPGREEVTDLPDLLFSMVASPTHPSRLPLFDLTDPRGIVERVEGFVFYDPSSLDFAARKQQFDLTIRRSKFVLCPRGTGTSSIRSFEVCAAGRVPVIISDDWVPPSGPDWSEFSLRWPEGSTEGLVDFLARHEEDALEMGRKARAAYGDWFAPDVMFHRMAERLSGLTANDRRSFSAAPIRDREYLELAARSLARGARAKVKGVRGRRP